MGRNMLIKLAYRKKLYISHPACLTDAVRLAACHSHQMLKIARRSKNNISPHGLRNAEVVHFDIAGPTDSSKSANARRLLQSRRIRIDERSKIGHGPVVGSFVIVTELG